jgi:hypothetical protein
VFVAESPGSLALRESGMDALGLLVWTNHSNMQDNGGSPGIIVALNDCL